MGTKRKLILRTDSPAHYPGTQRGAVLRAQGLANTYWPSISEDSQGRDAAEEPRISRHPTSQV